MCTALITLTFMLGERLASISDFATLYNRLVIPVASFSCRLFRPLKPFAPSALPYVKVVSCARVVVRNWRTALLVGTTKPTKLEGRRSFREFSLSFSRYLQYSLEFSKCPPQHLECVPFVLTLALRALSRRGAWRAVTMSSPLDETLYFSSSCCFLRASARPYCRSW